MFRGATGKSLPVVRVRSFCLVAPLLFSSCAITASQNGKECKSLHIAFNKAYTDTICEPEIKTITINPPAIDVEIDNENIIPNEELPPPGWNEGEEPMIDSEEHILCLSNGCVIQINSGKYMSTHASPPNESLWQTVFDIGSKIGMWFASRWAGGM